MVINDSGNSCCHPVSTTKTLKLNTEAYQQNFETSEIMTELRVEFCQDLFEQDMLYFLQRGDVPFENSHSATNANTHKTKIWKEGTQIQIM